VLDTTTLKGGYRVKTEKGGTGGLAYKRSTRRANTAAPFFCRTFAIAVLFSASRARGWNCHSGDSAGYDIGDRATPAACRCFHEVAKNGAQPARPRLVRRFCAAPAVCGLRARLTATNGQVRAGDPPIALLALVDEVIE
jgi:hypothetical protein